MVTGVVDNADCTLISGWAFNPSDPDGAVELELLLNTRRICTLRADGYRKDLRAIGYGNGCHAFVLPLPTAMFTAPLLTFHVRVARTGVDLVGSPVTVVNRLALLDTPALTAFAAAIAAEVEGAQSAGPLQKLAIWLLQQFDVVYQRQANLAQSTSARANRFFDMVGENTALSAPLREAAESVVSRYPGLHLPESDRPTVSVIIPAFNHFDVTYRCLQSIIWHRPAAAFEVILIDDGSTDDTVFAALVVSGGIRLVRLESNQGFLAAVMAGAERARGKYLLMLNNDTEVRPGWLDELLGTFERDANVGVAGAKLLFPDGTLQESGGIIWRQATGMNLGRGEHPAHCDFSYMRDVDYVSGSALLVSRKAFDAVGGLSAEFAPGYYEDTDLCFKARQAGYRVVVQPQSIVVHHEGVTSGTDPNQGGMKRFQRLHQAVFLEKWFSELQAHGLGTGPASHELNRAGRPGVLFIDDTVPTPDQDAGSNAAFEHMKALQRLGYWVGFVGSDNMAKISPYTEALERQGTRCFYAPYYNSVEEVLRVKDLGVAVVYLHRLSNMVKYEPMIRRAFPAARVIFNVADLHHLRRAREAYLKQDSALAVEAERLKAMELDAASRADAVIVHSSFEKKLLSPAGLKKAVHVIPWVVRPEPVRAPFEQRFGMALVGGFNHPPNVDAAEWLVGVVMPLIQAEQPDFECLIVGSQMPEAVLALACRGITVLGHVPDLQAVLERVRLTIAPLRYGAGLKGKVLTSLAAGLPCVMTNCAAEGMGLPSEFSAAIADTAEGLAAKAVAIHRDSGLNGRLSESGLRFVEATCSERRIDSLLRAALG